MTDEEQRIAIATAVGWVGLRLCWVTVDRLSVVGYGPDNPFPHDKGEQEPPDFLNDLNAMHAVEMRLSNEQYRHYDYELTRIRNHDCEHPGVCRCKSATARQRSEAFLKTKGLWK